MGGKLGIISALLAFAGIETEGLIASTRRRAVLWGALALLGLIALVFLLVALHAALAASYGPIIAPLIIAAIALVIGVVAALVFAALDAAQRKREEERRRAAEKSALMSSALIGLLPTLLKSPVLKQIGLPAIAALATALILRDRGDDGDGGDQA